MLPFTKWGPIDGSERKALLWAVLCSLVFIVLLGVVYESTRRTSIQTSRRVVVTSAPTQFLEPEAPRRADPNEQFRIVPANFNHIDFANHSYGLYTTSDRKKINLTLKSGVLELTDGSGWFELRDVFYKDLTGDQKPEAILRLTHVRCGVPCDGGADLFYIYTQRNGKLEPIWRYETGSYECSLKSFTIADGQLVLELFGRCPNQPVENPEPSQVMIRDLTYVLVEFDNQHVKQQSVEFFNTLPANPKSDKPRIRIF